MKKYGVGTLVPSKENTNGAGVSTPLLYDKYGTEVSTPEEKNNETAPKGIHLDKVPAPKAVKRFLPHIDMIGYYQFITFRTHDSLDDFIKKIRDENISSREQEYKIDQYIDKSQKGCYLNSEILDYLHSYFIGKDKSFYNLIAFSIMPNHVHMLFKQNIELPKIMKQMKGATAFEINKILQRKGIFWEANYYDKVIRDETHFEQVYDYIKYNAIKVDLRDAKERFYGINE
jgi:REP element-mobilizing transposase RayT